MTTNSPNPVDGDVQALTEKERIEQVEVVSSLIEKIVSDCANGWTAERDYLLPLQIALAAMTAEPFEYLTWHQGCRAPDDCEIYSTVAEKGDKSDDGSDAIPVYTTPPAQLLRQVELPQAFAYTIEGMEEYTYGWWLRKDDVIEALRQQGFEVKS